MTDVDGELATLKVYRRGAHDGVEREVGYSSEVPRVAFPEDAPDEVFGDDESWREAPERLVEAFGWDDPRRAGVEFQKMRVEFGTEPSAWEAFFVDWLEAVLDDVDVEWTNTDDAETGESVVAQKLHADELSPWSSPEEFVASTDGTDIGLRRANTPRGEARAAARGVREWLVESSDGDGIGDPESAAERLYDVLVLLPDDSQLVDLWRREFEALDLPVDAPRTGSLAETGFARWLVDVTALAGWREEPRSRPLLRRIFEGGLWSAGGFCDSIEADARGGELRGELREALRSYRGDSVEYGTWREHLKGRFSDDDGDASRAAWELSESLMEAVDTSGDTRDLFRRINRLLDDSDDTALGIRGTVHTRDSRTGEQTDDSSLFGAVRSAVRELSRLEAKLERGESSPETDTLESVYDGELRPERLLKSTFSSWSAPSDDTRPVHGVTLLPTRLYDGRSADKLIVSGLGEGVYPSVPQRWSLGEAEWARALGFDERLEAGDDADNQTRLYTAFANDQLDHQIDTVAEAVERCAVGKDSELTLSYFAEDPERSSELPPGPLMTLLVGGWGAEDWRGAESRVEHVAWADEIPETPKDTHGWRELNWFARGIDADAIEEARDQSDETTQSKLDDLLDTRHRLDPSVAAENARTPSPDDGTIQLGPRTGDLPGPYDAPEVYSASALQDYGQCGLKYFYKRGLRLDDDEDADRQLDALETGSAVHKAMFGAAREEIDENDEEPPRWALVFDGDDKESAVANVLAVAENHLERAFEEAIESEESLSDEYESRRVERWKSALANWASNRIERVKEWSDESTPDAINQYVIHVELAFGPPNGEQTEHGEDTDPASVTEPIEVELSDGTTVGLSGKVDRVDYDPDANLLAVRDYKSGQRKTASKHNTKFQQGESVQLPIYALALEQGIEEGHWNLPDGASVGAVGLEYFKSEAKTKNATEFVLSDELANAADSGDSLSYTDVVERWMQHHVQAIRDGIFPALPTSCPLEDERGAYCDYKKICGVNGNPLDEARVSDPRNTPEFSESTGLKGEQDIELGFVADSSEETENAELRARHQHAREDVVDLDTNVALAAGAGTGKTHSLVLRYLCALAEGCHPQELLCVTFTRKATADMRRRVRDTLLLGLREQLDDNKMQSVVSELQQSLNGAKLREIVTGLSASPVSTIDSLCADVLRAAEDVRGIGRVSSPNIVSGEAAEEVVERLVDDMFFDALETGDSRVNTIVDKLPPEEARENIQEAIHSHEPSVAWTTASVPEIRATIIENWERLNEASRKDDRLGDTDIESLAKCSANLVSLAADWSQKVRQTLREQGRLRHGDVLAIANEYLTDEDLRRKIAPQFPFRHIFVDELQDTNQAQLKFLRNIHSLAAETHAEDDEPQQFLVGDRKQSIFRFRDAEVDVFEKRLQDVRHDEEWAVGELTENRRSRPELIRTLNTLFQRWLPAGYGTDSEEDRNLADPGTEIAYEPLTWPESTPDKTTGYEGALVEVIATPGKGWERNRHRDFETDRRRSLVRRIGKLVDECESSQERQDAGNGEPRIAMLVPKWEMADEFQQRLLEFGITASIEGGYGLLETREARVLRAWLEAGLYRDRDTPLVAAAQGAGIGLSPTGLYCIRQGFGLDTDPEEGSGSSINVSKQLLDCQLDPDSAVEEWEKHGEVDRDTALSVLRDDRGALENFQRIFRDFRDELGDAPTANLLSKLCDQTGMHAFWQTKAHGRQRLANIDSTLDLIRRIEREEGIAPGTVHEELDRRADEDDPSSGGLVASGGADVVITSYWQAKGREWPVVVLPEIHKTKLQSGGSVGLNRFALRAGTNRKPETVYAPDAREAKRPNNPFKTEKSDVSKLLKEHRQRGDRAENRRLMYVAMTRAEDKIVMSGEFAGYHSNSRLPPKLAKDHKSWADAIYLAGGLVFEDGEPVFDERGAWGNPDGFEVDVYGPDDVDEFEDDASDDGDEAGGELDGGTLASLARRWRPVEAASRSVVSMSGVEGDPPVPAPDEQRGVEVESGDSPFEDEGLEGDVVHKGLEEWAFDEEPLEEDRWMAILDELGVAVGDSSGGRAAYADYLRRVFDNALAFDELVDELRAAGDRGELYTELPVRTESADSTLYRGVIDLVWRDDDGGLHLLDYKSGHDPRNAGSITEDDELADYYAQIRCYREALEEELAVTVVDTSLWYVDAGLLLTWESRG